MRLHHVYSHHNGHHEWQRRDLYEWLCGVFEAPHISIEKKSTTAVRDHVRHEFTNAGWSGEFRIADSYRNTLFSRRDDLAFHIQTGNMSRGPYDFLKLQYLFTDNRINAAALAMLTKSAAQNVGDNLVYSERMEQELILFSRVITVPILVLAIE